MPEITKICHGLTIGDLKFGNARPGIVEATLKPGETMEEALDELDERLNAWHRKRYPHLYQESKTGTGMDLLEHMQRSSPPGPLPEINLKDVRLKEEMEDRILAAESIDELQSIKAKYIAFPMKIHKLYNDKLEELSNGK